MLQCLIIRKGILSFLSTVDIKNYKISMQIFDYREIGMLSYSRLQSSEVLPPIFESLLSCLYPNVTSKMAVYPTLLTKF